MSNVTELLPSIPGEQPLQDDTALWRYVRLKTLLFHLDGLVFLPSLAKLAECDPFEAQFLLETRWYNGASREVFADRRDQVEGWIREKRCSQSERAQIARSQDFPDYVAKICRVRLFEFIRKTRYAWCWFESSEESAAMWTIYASQGVAIRSSLVKIRKLLEGSGRDFLYGRMRYVGVHGGRVRNFDPMDPSNAPLLLRPYFLKRLEYGAEREVRFVTSGPEARGRDGLVLRGCDPKIWMEEVRLWPGLSLAETNVLQKLVKRVLPDVPCERSDLMHAGRDNWAELNEQLAEIAFKQWGDQTDGIPPELKAL